ncbi:SDR family oxidoreductase [Lentzea nigeriaca]|uniref:SDR family oxidoreductase n=1 Tax=Lentzea nigeriaca TaxID=1128665 RepID=UPI00195B2629|nr:SDR family oxidoreductase [Lentzea nigeriaca]MBM7860441.1 NAD(P)-dependent dehydrogenase (short-subunit alcohol dehydrogenase family) [Lentzea nigeriaca]
MVVLVTGTSSGIGLAIAVQAAEAGHQVVATMRDTSRADALRAAAPDIDIRQLDVTDSDSITAAVDGVIRDYGRLDAVVNNAGAGHVGTVETDSVGNFRKVMETNFFGVVQVSKAAMPHLRASRGRLITVTSIGGVVGQPFNEAYCAAKFAVEGMMESLAPIAAAHGVSVTVVEPGAVASEFVTNVGVDVDKIFDAVGPYAPQMKSYLARTGTAFSSAQTSDEAAAVVLTTLAGERTPFRVQTSERAEQVVGLKLADLDGSAVQAMTRAWIS